jgi:hypothetical protein
MFHFGMHQESAQEAEEIEKLEKAEREIKARFPAAKMWQRSACHIHLDVMLGGMVAEVIAGLNGGYIVTAHNDADRSHHPKMVRTTCTSAATALDKAVALLSLQNLTAA